MRGNVTSLVFRVGFPMVAVAVGLTPDELQAAKYVRLTTSLGPIVLELDDAKAPKTVENFLKYVDSGHFDGTVFHRVIAGFMIQGGGMLPDGSEKKTNEPIENEADNGLKNDRYTIAMARTGDPHSATSQFFINVVDNPNLNHTWKDPSGWGYCVFGRVIDGFDTVEKIRTTKVKPAETAPPGREPEVSVPVETITLTKAERINDADASALVAAAAERRKQAEETYPATPDPERAAAGETMTKFADELKDAVAKATKTDSGLMYVDLKVGEGHEVTRGQSVEVHYTGWLTNGRKFDSSVDKNKPLTFGGKGDKPVIEGWNQGVVGMKVGGKRKLIIPPELGYKAAGYPGVIPGNSTLIFEIELLAIK